MTVPGASRPLLPASCVTSWNVRSSARKSGKARPVSASMTAATATPLKWCPFATICVPTSTAARAAAKRSSASRSASGLAVVSASSRMRSRPGTRAASSDSSFCVPGADARELDRAAVRAVLRQRLRVPAVVAVQPLVAVERQRDVAAPAPPRPAAGTAVDRARDASAVEEEDRAPASLLDGGELGEQRRRERIAALTPQVDDADARQRGADPRGEREPLEPRPALGPGRRAPVHGDRALQSGSLGGHRPRVVARVGLLLVGGVVLLVHDHEAEVVDGSEDRGARADDDARLAERDPLALVPAARRR